MKNDNRNKDLKIGFSLIQRMGIKFLDGSVTRATNR